VVGLTFAADVPAASTETVLALTPDLLGKIWLVPALPLFAFLIIIFFLRRTRMLAALVSIGALTGSFLISAAALMARIQHPHAPPQIWDFNWIVAGPLTIPLGCLVDNQSTVMLVVVTFVGTLIQIYSTGYMNHEPDFGFGKFFSYLSLFTASMLFLVLAPNFVQIYMGWELVGLCSYLLIGFWYYKNSAAQAAKKAFVVTRFGDLGFLMGILLIFHTTGTVMFLGADGALLKMAALAPTQMHLLTIACILIFCGAIGKSAQFPLQIWLPDAMEGPTPVSALIHAATMVAAGVYLVARCFDMFIASPDAAFFVAFIGGFTAFMAATMGVVQNDIKRVMAYSTVSQLGYMFMALGIGTSASFVAGNFHLVTHAFFKALLFLGCGSIIHAVNTNDMWKMGGVRKFMPITHVTFLCGSLALSGIPPFAGFWSKDEILAASWGSPHIILPIFGYVAAFLTALYVSRLYFVTFWGEYRGGDPHAPHDHSPLRDPAPAHDEHHDAHGHDDKPHENPLNMTGPLMILAVFATFLGFLNATPLHIEYFGHFMAPVGMEAHGGEHSALPLILSICIAASGWAVGYALYFKEPEKSEAMLKKQFSVVWRFLENKWYMDDIWAFLLKNTMFLGATACNWFDRYVVDGFFVMGSGKAAYFFGGLLREEHSGKVQQYAMMIVIAVVVVVHGVGVAEPTFVLSPTQIMQHFMKPGGTP